MPAHRLLCDSYNMYCVSTRPIRLKANILRIPFPTAKDQSIKSGFQRPECGCVGILIAGLTAILHDRLGILTDLMYVRSGSIR